jgi:two-component system LytT family response regulator
MARHAAADGRLRVAGSVGDGKAAVDAVRRLSPRLLLLDVEMPGLDGFGVLAELQRMGKPLPRVIFVTAFDRYAVRAFEIAAADYLLKPFDRERFQKALARVATRAGGRARAISVEELRALLGERGGERFLVKKSDGFVAVPLQGVDWIEAQGNYVALHAGAETHLLRETLQGLEQRLDPAGFARVLRTAIVNLRRVVALRPWHADEHVLVLEGGARIAVGPSYRERLEERLGAIRG